MIGEESLENVGSLKVFAFDVVDFTLLHED